MKDSVVYAFRARGMNPVIIDSAPTFEVRTGAFSAYLYRNTRELVCYVDGEEIDCVSYVCMHKEDVFGFVTKCLNQVGL